MAKISLISLTALLLSGCIFGSSSQTPNNGSSNNGGSNNGSNNGGTNNGGSNNGSNNGGSNNGMSNNGTSNNGMSNNGASNNGMSNNGGSNNGMSNNGSNNNTNNGSNNGTNNVDCNVANARVDACVASQTNVAIPMCGTTQVAPTCPPVMCGACSMGCHGNICLPNIAVMTSPDGGLGRDVAVGTVFGVAGVARGQDTASLYVRSFVIGQHISLTIPPGEPTDLLGAAVATQQSWVFLGAPGKGAVRYMRLNDSATQATSTGELTPDAMVPLVSRYGAALASAEFGNPPVLELFVGAPGANYVESRLLGPNDPDWSVASSGPIIHGALTPSPTAGYGSSLAVDDESQTLVVGAPGLERAFVLTYGQGWVDGPVLAPAVSTPSFGSSVAISGDGQLIAVGAPMAGEVHTFYLSGGAFVAGTVLSSTVGNVAANAEFGAAVAVQQNALLVGAPAANRVLGFIGLPDPAIGYVFGGAVSPPDAMRHFRFGSSLALHRGRLAAGGPLPPNQMGESMGWLAQVGN